MASGAHEAMHQEDAPTATVKLPVATRREILHLQRVESRRWQGVSTCSSLEHDRAASLIAARSNHLLARVLHSQGQRKDNEVRGRPRALVGWRSRDQKRVRDHMVFANLFANL